MRGQKHVRRLIFADDGRRLAAIGLHDVKIWNLAARTERRIALLSGPAPSDNKVNALSPPPPAAFGGAGRLLAAIVDHQLTAAKLCVWQAESGQEQFAISGADVQILEFSPDESILAVATTQKLVESVQSTLRLLRTADGTALSSPPAQDKYIKTITFSPDGALLAYSLADGHVVIWDVVKGSQVARWQAEGKEISSLTFTPDLKHLVVHVITRAREGDGGNDHHEGKFSVWRVAAPHDKPIRSFTYPNLARPLPDGPNRRNVRVSADGRTIELLHAGVIYRRDLITGEFGGEVPLRSLVNSFEALASAKGWIAQVPYLGGPDAPVELLERGGDARVLTPRAVLLGHKARALALAFSPDGRWLASSAGPSPSEVRLWDAKNGVEFGGAFPGVNNRWKLPVNNTWHLRCLAFSQDSAVLAMGNFNTASGPQSLGIIVLSIPDALKLTVDRSEAGCHSLAFCPDGKLLAAALWNGKTRLYELPSLKKIDEFAAGNGHLAFSDDSQMLAVGGSVRRLPNGAVVDLKVGSPFERVRFVPKNKYRLLCGADEVDVTTKVKVSTLDLNKLGLAADGRQVVHSPNAEFVAGVSQNPVPTALQHVRIVDRVRGSTVAILPNHASGDLQIAFSADSRMIATGDHQGVVRLWDVPK